MLVTQQLNSSNNTLVITINGEFNFAINKEFKPNKNFTVSVDLTRTDYMDSAALGMLLLLDEHFKEQHISLLNCSEYIKKALDVVKFEQKFIIT